MRAAPTHRSLAVAVALLAAAACARNPEPDEPATRRPVESASLEVQNDFKADVVVYAQRGGASPMRVGQVSAYSTGSFRLGALQLGSGMDVRFLVRAIGSRDGWASDKLTIRDGDRVELSLAARLSRSSYAIY